MKVAIAFLVLALAACSTPQEQTAKMAKLYEELYGPRCVALGYKAGTDAYTDCKLKLSTTK